MKSIVLHSGGMDSTVLLYQLVAQGDEVKALSIDYGQGHAKEIESARALAESLGVEHRVADLRSLAELLGGSALTSSELEVPEGHYEEDNMKATVVPNRNMILLAVSAGWAISSEFDRVAYAAHSGDHAIYPDCRPEFADALDAAVQLADWRKVSLHRPFVALSKADLVKLGADLQVPFERTWSCYKGRDLHCGRCGTCIERREAFHLAEVTDPTTYAADAPSIEEMVANDWKI
ncbi:MAG: 7-cyano-7-deazaguanine synthase QueC [Opitutales bacterium]